MAKVEKEKLLKKLDVQIQKEEVVDFTRAFRSLSADEIRQNKEYFNAVINTVVALHKT